MKSIIQILPKNAEQRRTFVSPYVEKMEVITAVAEKESQFEIDSYLKASHRHHIGLAGLTK